MRHIFILLQNLNGIPAIYGYTVRHPACSMFWRKVSNLTQISGIYSLSGNENVIFFVKPVKIPL